MGLTKEIEGIVCDRCQTKIALSRVDFSNKGLPVGWLHLTLEIYLCPTCVAEVATAFKAAVPGVVRLPSSVRRK